MKKLFLYAGLLMAVCLAGCDTPEQLEGLKYSFSIFRYTDESYKENIITMTQESGVPEIQRTNGIYNFPKRKKDAPYFRDPAQTDLSEFYFDICELATEEKVLPLHDGYYTYFPYTALSCNSGEPVMRDCKWEDICSVDVSALPEICPAENIYAEIRSFPIQTLEKKTGKSRKEMTIEDIEKAINEIIDNGEIDKYGEKVPNISASTY